MGSNAVLNSNNLGSLLPKYLKEAQEKNLSVPTDQKTLTALINELKLPEKLNIPMEVFPRWSVLERYLKPIPNVQKGGVSPGAVLTFLVALLAGIGNSSAHGIVPSNSRLSNNTARFVTPGPTSVYNCDEFDFNCRVSPPPEEPVSSSRNWSTLGGEAATAAALTAAGLHLRKEIKDARNRMITTGRPPEKKIVFTGNSKKNPFLGGTRKTRSKNLKPLARNTRRRSRKQSKDALPPQTRRWSQHKKPVKSW